MYPCDVAISAPICSSAFKCKSTGRAPIAHPPGRETRAAAITCSAEFFAPLTATVPRSAFPPLIRNLSIRSLFVVADLQVRSFLLFHCVRAELGALECGSLLPLFFLCGLCASLRPLCY